MDGWVCGCGCIRAKDYNTLSLREQLAVTVATDVMVGPHGAGLSHTVVADAIATAVAVAVAIATATAVAITVAIATATAVAITVAIATARTIANARNGRAARRRALSIQ